jgi:hypothetical protein
LNVGIAKLGPDFPLLLVRKPDVHDDEHRKHQQRQQGLSLAVRSLLAEPETRLVMEPTISVLKSW